MQIGSRRKDIINHGSLWIFIWWNNTNQLTDQPTHFYVSETN